MSLRKDKWYVRFRKEYTNNTRSRSTTSLSQKRCAKDCVKPSDDQIYITINDEGRTPTSARCLTARLAYWASSTPSHFRCCFALVDDNLLAIIPTSSSLIHKQSSRIFVHCCRMVWNAVDWAIGTNDVFGRMPLEIRMEQWDAYAHDADARLEHAPDVHVDNN
jgi:hypothetical protein